MPDASDRPAVRWETELLRRPLCTGLLLFLAVYLTVCLGLSGIRQGSGQSQEGADQGSAPGMRNLTADEAELWSGKEILLIGRADDFEEPADGSQENISFRLGKITILSSKEGESFQSEQLSCQFKKNEYVLCKLKNGGELPMAGSTVKVRGTLRPFIEATNPGEFDAASYYELRGYVCSLQNVEILAQGESYDRLENLLYELRRETAQLYTKVLGNKNGAVASAMVLGMKKGMDEEIKTLYQDAGISHLLAISGLHVSLIGMALWKLLKKLRLPQWAAAALSILLLVLYGQLTGMSVSTKRAVIMFVFLMAAKVLGRTADSLTSLAEAACFILIAEPGYLMDSGFQLSFSAAAGAVTVVPMLQEEGIKAPETQRSFWKKAGKNFWQGVLASLGITLSMLPFLLRNFYQWNPWSLIINPIVIGLMGLLLPGLLLLAALGRLAAAIPGGIRLLKATALPLRGIFFFYEKICELMTSLPGSCLITGAPKGWQILLFEAGFLALLVWGRELAPFLRVPLAGLLSCIFLIRLPQPFQITMLDVGQGECLYVETQEHDVWLVDAGSSSNSAAGKYQIVPFLKQEGVRCLEGIFVTHWDADHVNGLEDIFSWAAGSHVKIKRMILPEISFSDGALKELLELAGRYRIPVVHMEAGNSIRDKKAVFTCLHPYPGEIVTDRNAASLVLRLDYGEFSALFTGDLEQEGESWLIQQYGKEVLSCNLLDAGHHGSSNASTGEFLDCVKPWAVLISCGRNNRYGHPAPDTMERLADRNAEPYVTAYRGAVTVTVSRDRIRIRGFLE